MASLVHTGQAATLVLGQPDMTSIAANSPGESAQSMHYPWGLASFGHRLWLGDDGNARVLQWDSAPSASGQAADLVIGQPSATAHESGLGRNRLRADSAIFVTADATHLYVSDNANSRVMIWQPLPSASGENAAVVLGQPDFDTAAAGNGATQLNQPKGLWTDGIRLVVADTGNSRVLMWNAIPTANTQPADLVLGQPDFGVGATLPASDSTMNRPEGVWSDGKRLFVADTGNHRVMVWPEIPVANGTAASFFIGQSAADGAAPNAGSECPTTATLNAPANVIVESGSLFVADTGNHRVLVFTPLPTSSGAAAAAVLGHDYLDTGDLEDPSAAHLNSPRGLAVLDGRLFVSQAYWNRVTAFELDL